MMKRFVEEFKSFALRGNVIDLTVGVLVGGAFNGLVTSLSQNIISPIIGMFGGADFNKFVLTINDTDIKYGAFITAVINFFILAFIVFLIVKVMRKLGSIDLMNKDTAAPTETKPTTKDCPYCCTEIKIEARRCPHCTSVLDDAAENI